MCWKDFWIDEFSCINIVSGYDNVPRILPADVDVHFDCTNVPVPPIFKVMVEAGKVDPVEAYRVFNMGVGMVWFVPADEADKALEIINGKGFTACRVGEVVAGSGVVVK